MTEMTDAFERCEQLIRDLRTILLGSTLNDPEAAGELEEKLTEILHDFTGRAKT